MYFLYLTRLIFLWYNYVKNKLLKKQTIIYKKHYAYKKILNINIQFSSKKKETHKNSQCFPKQYSYM